MEEASRYLRMINDASMHPIVSMYLHVTRLTENDSKTASSTFLEA